MEQSPIGQPEQKSFVRASVFVFLLYWLLYIPGLVANIVWLRRALRIRKATGQSPAGFGCLNVLLWAGLIPLFFFIHVYDMISHTRPHLLGDVARVQSDLRTKATAIEAYHIDHGVFPAYTFDRSQGPYAGHAPEFERTHGRIPTFLEPGDMSLQTLAGPEPYITSYFHDPFLRRDVPEATYAYWHDGGGWIVWSPGPDRRYAITDPAEVYNSAEPHPPGALLLRTYDPTNGANSPGDIWRIKATSPPPAGRPVKEP